MNEKAGAGRGAKQERSIARRARMAQAAIDILAAHGVAGLTHRLVADKAGVSLAATTYYFDTKYDILAEASKVTLDGYVAAFHRAAGRMQAEGADPGAFRRLATRLVRNAAVRDRARTTCWAEILLDARRHPESLALARHWFAELAVVWLDIARAAHVAHPHAATRSAIDLVMGLLFMTIALGLDEGQVEAVLEDGGDPMTVWRIAETPDAGPDKPARASRKSAATRERILSATVDILISDGPGAVAYRAIAARAGLTPAGPFYHFPTIAGLLASAQERLFAESKQRYRQVAAADPGGELTAERLIDRTVAVLMREATEFAGNNLAAYAIWIDADRKPGLRPMIWSAIEDQHLAWQRILARVMARQRPIDALLAQALFIGKLVRLLATGSELEDLALVRGELADDIHALVEGRFWL